jgi:hypothetical protein
MSPVAGVFPAAHFGTANWYHATQDRPGSLNFNFAVPSLTELLLN